MAVFSLCQSQQKNLVKNMLTSSLTSENTGICVSEGVQCFKNENSRCWGKGPDSNTNKDETPLWNADAMGALFAAGICSVLTRCMDSEQNNTELKDKRLRKSVWLFLWVSTLAHRLGDEELDGVMLALGWSTDTVTEGPKQEKISFQRTYFRAQLNIFTTWYKYCMPSFASYCLQFITNLIICL